MNNSNNLVFSKNLIYYMEQKGIDRIKLCKDLGFKYSTVSEWISAKKYPRMDKIELLAEYFGIKKSYLIENAHNSLNKIPYSEDDSVLIPLIGRVAAGYACRAENNITEYIRADRDVINEGYEYFWLEVKGDSMEPELREGDLVLVREQNTLDARCYAVVIVDDEDGLVKRVDIEEGSKITLSSVNPYYPPRVFENKDANRVRIVGRVVEVKRRFL